MSAARPARPLRPRRRLAAALLVILALLLTTIAARTLLMSGAAPVPALAIPELAIDLSAAAERLGTAIRFRTLASQDAGADAAAFEAMRNWLVQAYPSVHAAATHAVVGGGTLVFVWEGSDASLPPAILMAHQDVVPATSGDRWTHAPFSGAVADASVWGRGSIDNKGALVAMLEAAEALLRAGRRPQRTLILVFGHDEETGGSGARAAAQWLAQRGVRAQFVLDEGSIVVADHPVTGAPVALVGISEKGYATVRLTATSRGGHASAPPAQTAVGTLARAIDTLLRRPFPKRYDGPTRDMLHALAPAAPLVTRMAIANDWLFRPLLVHGLGASPQGAAMLQTTLAPTMLVGAPKENVLPTEASALVNLRIAPGETVAGALAHLQKAVKELPVSIELAGDSHDPSPVSPVDTDAYRLIAGAARGVFGVPVAPAPVIAATDSRNMTGLSANIYRFQPVMLTLAQTERIHGVDEHLPIAAFGQMIRFYAAVIMASPDDASL